MPVHHYYFSLALVHKSADCSRDAQCVAQKNRPLCFCGNCFSRRLHRLSDWATSQSCILREVLSTARELARKSFWVPIQWQLGIIYKDSTIRGCGPQKRWRAELLPPHCQRRCYLSPAVTDGQVRTRGKKKGQRSLHRVLAIAVPLGDTRRLCIHKGLIRTGVSSHSEECKNRAKMNRIIII